MPPSVDGRTYRCENGHPADGMKPTCERVLDSCVDVGCKTGGHEPGMHMGRYCGRNVHPTSCEHPIEGYTRHRTILGLVGDPAGPTRQATFFTIDRCGVCHAERARPANAEEADALLRQATGHSLADLSADVEKMAQEMREGSL